MTDRQTLAVARAIYNSYWQGKDKWPDATDNERALNIDMAKSAIAASDAKYVPMLVEALKEIESIGSPTSLIASIALGNLPEELQK